MVFSTTSHTSDSKPFNEVLVSKVKIIDPPSGWMYGFPKVIPDDVADTTKWLVDNGYPKEEIRKDYFHTRHWYQPLYELWVCKKDFDDISVLSDMEYLFDLVKCIDYHRGGFDFLLWSLHHNKKIVIDEDLIEYAFSLEFKDNHLWDSMLDVVDNNNYINLGNYLTSHDRFNTNEWFKLFVNVCERSDSEEAEDALDKLMEFNWS